MYGPFAFRRLPIEILRDQYISLFGGWSIELKRNEVGLNERSLSDVNIVPYTAKVILRKFDPKSALPLFFKKWFDVVPLGKGTPDAYFKSPKGEVVLPESERTSREFSDLIKGDILILNNVLGRRVEDPIKRHDIISKHLSRSAVQ